MSKLALRLVLVAICFHQATLQTLFKEDSSDEPSSLSIFLQFFTRMQDSDEQLRNCTVLYLRNAYSDGLLPQTGLMLSRNYKAVYNLDATITSNVYNQNASFFRRMALLRGMPSFARCFLTLHFLSDDKAASIEEINSITNFKFVKPWYPLTSKNRDYYLFVNLDGNDHFDSFISEKALALEIKNKLLVSFSSKQLMLKTLCFYCANGNPTVKEVNLENLFPDLTKNLNGKQVGISVHYPSPSTHMYLKDGEYVPNGTGGGYLRPAITASEVLNFTYKLIPAASGGTRLKNGTWTDHIGNILSGRAELASFALPFVYRLPYVDTCAPAEFSHLAFVHASPKQILSWKLIFWPFSTVTWAAFIATAFATISLLTTFNVSVHNAHRAHAWSIMYSVWVIVSSVLLQSVSKPKTWEIRWFLTSWFFFMALLTQAYLSDLFGFFVSPRLESVPSNLRELAMSDYQAGITYKGAVLEHFKYSKKGSTLQKVYRKFTADEIHQCYRNVLERSQFVCVSLKYDIEFTLRVEHGDRAGRSKLVFSLLDGYNIATPIILKKRSILFPSVNRVTSACFENGLTYFWRTRTIEEQRAIKRFNEKAEKKTQDELKREPHALSAKHLRGAITVILAGFCSSVFAFIAEFIHDGSRKIWIVAIRLMKNASHYLPYIQKMATIETVPKRSRISNLISLDFAQAVRVLAYIPTHASNKNRRGESAGLFLSTNTPPEVQPSSNGQPHSLPSSTLTSPAPSTWNSFRSSPEVPGDPSLLGRGDPSCTSSIGFATRQLTHILPEVPTEVPASRETVELTPLSADLQY